MSWDWIEKEEKRIEEERSKDYFDIKEGSQKFILLSHFAPLPLVFEGGKYRNAEEGDKNVTIRGVAWVLQDGVIKLAKLPYTITQVVHEISQNPEWEFTFPFPHEFTFTAKGAKTKEVEYSLTPSPKKTEIPATILDELKKKSTPEEVVEKMRGKSSTAKTDYPEGQINPEDIPF